MPGAREIHLKPGERRVEVEPVVLGDRLRAPARRRASRRAMRLGAAPASRGRAARRASPSSRPISLPVSRRQPPSARARRAPRPRADRRRGRWRSRARRSAARAVSNARSIAPGSSGFGNATVGNAPSGSSCADTGTRRGVAGRLEDARQRLPADAVHRRVDPAQAVGARRARARPRRSRRRTRRRRDSAAVSKPSERGRAAMSPSSATRWMCAAISASAGEHDLRRRRPRRRGRPCSRCRWAGCGSRSP